jgi:hypothetical protein
MSVSDFTEDEPVWCCSHFLSGDKSRNSKEPEERSRATELGAVALSFQPDINRVIRRIEWESSVSNPKDLRDGLAYPLARGVNHG